MAAERVIRIAELSPSLPAQHYDLASRRVVDAPAARVLRVSQVVMEPAGRSDPHVHPDAEQLYIVLAGEMGVRVGGEALRLGPGEAVLIRPGERHENFNVHPGRTEYLSITGRLAPR